MGKRKPSFSSERGERPKANNINDRQKMRKTDSEFNQNPSMPSIPDEQKPAIGKVIAPKVLFWFRWAAFATILTGLIVAYLNGYLHQAMT